MEVGNGTWRKINCSARQQDGDLIKILRDWLGREYPEAKLAERLNQGNWHVVHDVMQTECEIMVLSAGYRVSGSESVHEELAQVVKHKEDLIRNFKKLLDGDGVRDPGTELAADNTSDSRALVSGGSSAAGSGGG
jgi:hypothetical protein